MTTKEKILLVQLILKDIRDNWSGGWFGHDAEDRALKAKDLCKEISKETNNNDYLKLANACTSYVNGCRQSNNWDGKFFEKPFPRGYENMDSLHNLNHTYNDKSDDFQSIAEEYLTSLDESFED